MKEVLELFVDNNIANAIYIAQRMASKCNNNDEMLEIINEMFKLQRKLSKVVSNAEYWGFIPHFLKNC